MNESSQMSPSMIVIGVLDAIVTSTVSPMTFTNT